VAAAVFESFDFVFAHLSLHLIFDSSDPYFGSARIAYIHHYTDEHIFHKLPLPHRTHYLDVTTMPMLLAAYSLDLLFGLFVNVFWILEALGHEWYHTPGSVTKRCAHAHFAGTLGSLARSSRSNAGACFRLKLMCSTTSIDATA
jgi:hypothetical protein